MQILKFPKVVTGMHPYCPLCGVNEKDDSSEILTFHSKIGRGVELSRAYYGNVACKPFVLAFKEFAENLIAPDLTTEHVMRFLGRSDVKKVLEDAELVNLMCYNYRYTSAIPGQPLDEFWSIFDLDFDGSQLED